MFGKRKKIVYRYITKITIITIDYLAISGTTAQSTETTCRCRKNMWCHCARPSFVKFSGAVSLDDTAVIPKEVIDKTQAIAVPVTITWLQEFVRVVRILESIYSVSHTNLEIVYLWVEKDIKCVWSE